MSVHPDRQQCYKYLEEYGTPAHVIGHCKGVAAVAYVLAKALNAAGGTLALPMEQIRMKKVYEEGRDGWFAYAQDHEGEAVCDQYRDFDLDVTLAAGLLHDMARVDENHWDVAADFCRDHGYLAEEPVIRVHMKYEFTNDAYHLTEADLVSIADRIVLEDRYVGLDERMEYICQKAEKKGDFKARPIIMEKKALAQAVLDEIEVRLGCTIDSLMENIDYENIEK